MTDTSTDSSIYVPVIPHQRPSPCQAARRRGPLLTLTHSVLISGDVSHKVVVKARASARAQPSTPSRQRPLSHQHSRPRPPQLYSIVCSSSSHSTPPTLARLQSPKATFPTPATLHPTPTEPHTASAPPTVGFISTFFGIPGLHASVLPSCW